MKRILSLAVLSISIQWAAFAADPVLMSLVMPDATVIAGIQVDQAKLSPFGQYVLSHMQPDDAGYKSFVQETNFDPKRDLSEVLMTSNVTSDVSSHWLILARGVFDTRTIAAAVQAKGGSVTQFQGVNIYSGASTAKPGEDTVISFLDG